MPFDVLASIALPSGSSEGVFVMLKGYFDDSGTHADSDVVVVGGLIGTVAQWQAFEADWLAKLAEPLPGKPPLKSFHLSPCKAGKGEFEGYSLAERDAVRHDFRQILIKHKLIATASALDKRAWDELVHGGIRELFGEAVNIPVENCMLEAIKIAERHPEGDKIAVVFDRGIWTKQIKRITDEFTYSLGRPRVMTVTFMRVEDSTALQGADIVATENYWYATDFIKTNGNPDPHAHMKHFLGNMFAEGLMVTREAIAANLPEIETMLKASLERSS